MVGGRVFSAVAIVTGEQATGAQGVTVVGLYSHIAMGNIAGCLVNACQKCHAAPQLACLDFLGSVFPFGSLDRFVPHIHDLRVIHRSILLLERNECVRNTSTIVDFSWCLGSFVRS